MSILITGSDGFLSRNFFFYIKNKTNEKIFLYNKKKTLQELQKYIYTSKLIFHFAGENRSKKKSIQKKQ